MTINPVYINDNGLIVFDMTTGTFSGIELTTKGDLLTHDVSNYARKAVGTNTHALISDSTQSTGLNYAAKSAGSAVTFLQSQTASSSSSINFTSPFDDATYLYYIFTYTNVRPSTDGVELRLRVSVNGGSSWLSSDYRWVRMRINSSSGSDTINEDDSDSKIELAQDLGNATGEGLSGQAIYIPSANPGSVNAGFFLHDNCYFQDTGTFFRNFGVGMNETSSVVNGIQFFMDSGNIATGIFKMYGVSKT